MRGRIPSLDTTPSAPADTQTISSRTATAAAEGMADLAVRVTAEFRDKPGLRLTLQQAARLFGLELDTAWAVLDELRRARVLGLSSDGSYSCSSEAAERKGGGAPVRKGRVEEPLKEASLDRLACLLRHWTWANEAMGRFEQELADGWNDDEDPIADHPFGSYYHWCGLLCGFGEAALGRGLLSPSQLDAIRCDLDASLPGLRACRQLLVVIPSTREEQPPVVEFIREDEGLGRLRRLHEAFGEALQAARMSRAVDSLDH